MEPKKGEQVERPRKSGVDLTFLRPEMLLHRLIVAPLQLPTTTEEFLFSGFSGNRDGVMATSTTAHSHLPPRHISLSLSLSQSHSVISRLHMCLNFEMDASFYL